MNRRQFLGRFFQSMISLHNSHNCKGIYHPWRQYEKVKTYVSLNLKYRVGVKATPHNATNKFFKIN